MQIWFKFDEDHDEDPTHTANIFDDEDGARIEWWNEAVGLVTTDYRDTVAEAEQWLESAGYQDFTA